MNHPIFGEVISSYTRADALEDGVLVDVSETAREAGIQFPVAVTQRVWHELIVPSEGDREWGQDTDGRLWDTVWMLLCAIKRGAAGERINYTVIYLLKGRQRHVKLKALCGPGDNLEPVITIMLPDED